MAATNPSNYNPTPFTSMAQVLARRQPLTEGIVLAHSDCLTLAPFPNTNGGLWISTPNVEFVPEPPRHRPGQPLRYFADGMLGAFEHMKWPQLFDEQEPHTLAAPGNPDLIYNLKFQEIPLLDFKCTLPDFQHPAIAWEGLQDSDFVVSLHLRHEDVGFLAEPLHYRIRSAANEVIVMVLKVVDTELDEMFARRSDREQYTERRKHYVLRQIDYLRRACSRLQETPMSYFDVVMWYRDTQRLILGLRAWLIYMKIIKPRLDNPEFADYDNVLPLRGVLTKNESIVHTMHRCGVPVWWVRPLHTLTDRTTIIRVHEPVLSKVHFSSETEMSHRGRHWVAPDFLGAKILDESLQGFGDMLRRYSLTGKPTVRRAVAVLEVDRQAMEDNMIEEDTEAGTMTTGISETTRDDQVAGGSPSDSRKRRKGPRKGHGQPPQATRPPVQRPHWMYAVSTPWDVIHKADPALVIPSSKRALTYILPPLHLFFADGDAHAQKVQNWLRIRQWCMFHAYANVDQAPVLMTTAQWRIALEGRYFAVHYPKDAPIQPQSSPEDIALLRKAPESTSSLGKRARADVRSGDGAQLNTTERRRLRRLMERVDIHVRFGVKGGFLPYQPDLAPIPKWDHKPIDFHQASVDTRLWATLTWEISVTMFRLELLALDQEVVPDLYDPAKTKLSRPREFDILTIWNEQCRVWEEPGKDSQDWLTSPEWRVRRVAIGRMLFALEAWPIEEPRLPRWDERKERQETFAELEKEVVLYYCRRFYSLRGRSPTFPLMRPHWLPPTKTVLY